jgi:alpha-N-arabinofuranosidase
MILTDKEKMILTPTYYDFQMYTVHHEAKRIPIDLQAANYELGSDKLPAVNASASKDDQGRIHVTLCNLNPNSSAEVSCQVDEAKIESLTGRLLTATQITSHNTFDKPDEVKPVVFDGLKKTAQGFVATLPAKSVVMVEVR